MPSSRYRWAVLAIGAFSTAAMAATQSGLPALGPAFQDGYGLDLVRVTAVFTAFGLGTVATVYAWGALADRVGERLVLALGPLSGAVVLVGVTVTGGYLALLAGMFVCGVFAAAATSGSGRAVFGWFPRDERGLALGLRQTAVPVGAAAASFSLPVLALATSLDAALIAMAALLAASSLVAAVWLREPPPRRSAAPPAPPAARDPRIWRLGAVSALLIVGQVGVTSLLVLYLFSERGWSATEAAVALGVVQLGGAVARIGVGRWSDRRDDRIGPFRLLAGLAGSVLAAAALTVGASSAVFVPLLMAGGVFAMSWNGLSFTAAAEISGGTQAGRAMGLQNTLMRLAAAAVPLGLGALAAATSWQLAFLLMAAGPLAGATLLGPLAADEDRRRRERRARIALEPTIPADA